MPHGERLESSPLFPKPTARSGPGPSAGCEKVHIWERRQTYLAVPAQSALAPLLGSLLDDSGHGLNILGDQGATKFEGQSSYRIPNRPTTNCLGEY